MSESSQDQLPRDVKITTSACIIVQTSFSFSTAYRADFKAEYWLKIMEKPFKCSA